MRTMDKSAADHTEAVLAEIKRRGRAAECPVTGAVIVEGMDVTDLVEMIDVDPSEIVDAIEERI